MKIKPLLLCLLCTLISLSAYTQRNRIWLKDQQEVIKGDYYLTADLAYFRSTQEYSRQYGVDRVDSAYVDGRHYIPVFINNRGNKTTLFAERIADGEMDLYRIDQTTKVGFADDIRERFYYLVRDGVVTRIPQENLKNFYIAYFGDCYEQIQKKRYRYAEAEFVDLISAYSNCRNPGSGTLEIIEDKDNKWSVGMGGFVGLNHTRHYPKLVVTNGVEIPLAWQTGFTTGLGAAFQFKQGASLALEFEFNSYGSFTSDTLTFSGANPPRVFLIDHSFNTIFGSIYLQYQIGKGSWTVHPGAGARLGKIIGAEQNGQIFVRTNQLGPQVVPLDNEANSGDNMIGFAAMVEVRKALTKTTQFYSRLSYAHDQRQDGFQGRGYTIVGWYLTAGMHWRIGGN